MKSSLIIVLLLASFVFAVPLDKRQAPPNPPSCNGFRITSPVIAYYNYTEGQCYQVSFDKGASSVTFVTKVDLFKEADSTFVENEFTGNVDASTQIATPYFNLKIDGLPTGTYYYNVTAITSVPGESCFFRTVPFVGIVNPNSPPVQCPPYPPS
ncbi:4737_t:CDS:2 [Ambispora leptoticha]|uniref:4737_t:CDS:1 n=1 Tax=Ambispora leptoticha TaxID=144679 RepID=A0A9N9CQN7_9GLOM|nr:4737_t:CDS:2 [Ambispora leptoticha]